MDTNILAEHVVRMRCKYFCAGCKEGEHSDPWEGSRLYVSSLPQISSCVDYILTLHILTLKMEVICSSKPFVSM
jgi:hypothetical protein